jgi:1,2-phenylacetyl-CoA epoxidase PaaB subunit
VLVWDVFGRRTDRNRFALVGSILAPDVHMALVLARETHFRHKEGVAYAVRRRGDHEMHEGPYDHDLLGGVTDRSYRRQEAYVGVGARHKAVGRNMAQKGLVIDRPRPSAGRARRPPERASPRSVEPEDPSQVSPEEIAAHGTGG